MATSSVILLVLFGMILLCVIVAVFRQILTRKNDEENPDCYMNLFFDILFQTVVLGDSLIASILITDKDFGSSIKTRADLVIVFSCINFVMIVFQFIWPSVPTPAKQRAAQQAYEQKVIEVQKAQRRLMANHNKARRIGMRNVSASRANRIRKAQPKSTCTTDPEMCEHTSNDDQVNKDEIKMDTLPSGYKIYYNNDGIPYYYNTNTGETTWKHPAGSIKHKEPTIPSMNAPHPMQSVAIPSETKKENKTATKKENNATTKILIVPRITGTLIRFYKRIPAVIFGFVDIIFDIVVASALLGEIIFSGNAQLLISLATYIGVFIEFLVLCCKIHGRFATVTRIQQGKWAGVRLLGFIVLVEFIGVVFECGVGLYLLFGVIQSKNVALVVCGAIMYIFMMLYCVLPTLPFICRGVCMSHNAMEPIYREN